MTSRCTQAGLDGLSSLLRLAAGEEMVQLIAVNCVHRCLVYRCVSSSLSLVFGIVMDVWIVQRWRLLLSKSLQ